jgi:hypothetical protein
MADYSNPYLGQNNPYLQSNIDKAQGDLVRSYNNTTQPAYNSAMVKSGSFGNSGVQQMNENAQRNLQDNLGNVSNSMRMQDYNNQQDMYRWDQGFNRSLYNDAYSQNMNNLTTGVGLLGTLAGYNANDLTNANNIQNTPLNYWSNFANQANGFGQGYGTATSTMGTSSNPLMGALGGAQLGNAAMGWWNRQNPSYGASSNTSGYSTSPAWDNWTTNGSSPGYGMGD